MKKTWLLFIAITIGISLQARPFKIIADNKNGKVTTDTVMSGDFVIGINDFGGGSISTISIPGIGNIMGPQALSYGRMGQSSIRDAAHGGKYNPTQAGFNETIGTECEIVKTPGKLVIVPRGCALWKADGSYDYTQWENIGSDSYNNKPTTKHASKVDEEDLDKKTKPKGKVILNAKDYVDNGNSDMDDLDETNLKETNNEKTYSKQEAEVFSEFDYYGEFENCKGRFQLAIPTIRHYFEYRFIRKSGHCLNQFREGTLLWNPDALQKNIPNNYPQGDFAGTDKDMNVLIASMSIRNDLDLWNPKFRYTLKNDGVWSVEDRKKPQEGIDTKYKLVFIIAESNDENKGKALGFYRPASDINVFQIVGVNEKTGSIVYKDNRMADNFWLDSPYRTPKMSWIGFRNRSKGMINRTRLPKDVYETYRQEIYFFYGTPKQIKDAVAAFDKANNL